MAPKKKKPEAGDNVPESARSLHSFVQRMERLHDDKKALSEDIKVVRGEVKSAGFDMKVFNEVLKRRAKDRADVEEFDNLLATYETALDAVLT